MEPIGIYLHVPFCLQKCPYCDFYSLPFSPDLADRYLDAVLRSIRAWAGSYTADTVYFGGGTPSILGAERLAALLSAVVRAFQVDLPTAEITLEANPATVTARDLVLLREAGFNRISIGVQSLHPRELDALGRAHTSEDALAAIADAHSAGFANIAADLILAVPHQTAQTLQSSIRSLTGTPVNHISAYLLKLEPGTRFWAQKDALPLPDEDAVADLYLEAVRLLQGAGYAQYEISNFSKNGAVSRHNLKYWRGVDYLGIGPGAHSSLDGERFFFPRDLPAFLEADDPRRLLVRDGPAGGLEERVMLGLRLSCGVDLAKLDLPKHHQQAILAKSALLESRGLLRVSGSVIALTPEGFLLQNAITAELLYATGVVE